MTRKIEVEITGQTPSEAAYDALVVLAERIIQLAKQPGTGAEIAFLAKAIRDLNGI